MEADEGAAPTQDNRVGARAHGETRQPEREHDISPEAEGESSPTLRKRELIAGLS